MKQLVLLLGLSVLALIVLCSCAHARIGETVPTSIDSAVRSSKSHIRDSLRRIPYTKGYSWISLTTNTYRSVFGEDYRDIFGGLTYERMISNNVSIGGQLKIGTNSLEIGPRITYTYAYPRLARKFLVYVSAAPSYLAEYTSDRFLKPLDKEKFHLPIEFGFGFKLYNHIELIVSRAWAVTAAGFDVGSSLELRYGIMP